jgi:hypothetical protein
MLVGAWVVKFFVQQLTHAQPIAVSTFDSVTHWVSMLWQASKDIETVLRDPGKLTSNFINKLFLHIIYIALRNSSSFGPVLPASFGNLYTVSSRLRGMPTGSNSPYLWHCAWRQPASVAGFWLDGRCRSCLA